MKVAIDIDGTITTGNQESIDFFGVLTNLLIDNHSIYILTNREKGSEQDIAVELDYYGIDYTDIIITDNKADFILWNEVSIYFENEDENFISLPESVLVFKVRESGNFDFTSGKWIYSEKTGMLVQ